ncbi:MAG: sigma-70 family RNA polymerase sigma factor [Ruminococcus sp.]|nr:sigma-70 family RNA polymerase sigma factor [Ruminococcus sp.]
MLPMIYMALVDESDLPDFEQLYIKYKQQLYRVAFSILHNEQDSEDALQNAFINIANNFKKISEIPCNELTAYLVIICRNAAINIYNTNKTIAQRTAALDETVTSEDVIACADDKEALIQAIKQLPQEYKDIIFLYELRDFSAKETAKLLGISENLVRVKAHRARKMLKSILTGGDGS